MADKKINQTFAITFIAFLAGLLGLLIFLSMQKDKEDLRKLNGKGSVEIFNK